MREGKASLDTWFPRQHGTRRRAPGIRPSKSQGSIARASTLVLKTKQSKKCKCPSTIFGQRVSRSLLKAAACPGSHRQHSKPWNRDSSRDSPQKTQGSAGPILVLSVRGAHGGDVCPFLAASHGDVCVAHIFHYFKISIQWVCYVSPASASSSLRRERLPVAELLL